MTCRRNLFLHLWFSFSLCYFLTPYVIAQQTIIIDDQLGDSSNGVMPIYTPSNGWTQGSTCTGCGFHPDPSLAMNGTWHDTTHHTYDEARTVQFSFTGTSLDVYCILPNPSIPTLTSTYALDFTLDGHPVGNTFTHISNGSDIYQYNVSVFSIQGLAQMSHIFTMSESNTSLNSTMQFDYAIYTVLPPPSASVETNQSPSTSGTSSTSVQSAESADTTSSTKSDSSKANAKLGAILGGVIGSLVVVATILALLYQCRHRLRHRHYASLSKTTVEPFYAAPKNQPMQYYNRPHPTTKASISDSGIRYPEKARKPHHQKEDIKGLRREVAQLRAELRSTELTSTYPPPDYSALSSVSNSSMSRS